MQGFVSLSTKICDKRVKSDGWDPFISFTIDFCPMRILLYLLKISQTLRLYTGPASEDRAGGRWAGLRGGRAAGRAGFRRVVASAGRRRTSTSPPQTPAAASSWPAGSGTRSSPVIINLMLAFGISFW